MFLTNRSAWIHGITSICRLVYRTLDRLVGDTDSKLYEQVLPELIVSVWYKNMMHAWFIFPLFFGMILHVFLVLNQWLLKGKVKFYSFLSVNSASAGKFQWEGYLGSRSKGSSKEFSHLVEYGMDLVPQPHHMQRTNNQDLRKLKRF